MTAGAPFAGSPRPRPAVQNVGSPGETATVTRRARQWTPNLTGPGSPFAGRPGLSLASFGDSGFKSPVSPDTAPLGLLSGALGGAESASCVQVPEFPIFGQLLSGWVRVGPG